MIENPEDLIAGFRLSLRQLDLEPNCAIEHERQSAPHVPHDLPLGKCAAYIFSLSEHWKASDLHCSGSVLKVGKAGPNSNARFRGHHYSPAAAPSTLAGSVIRATIQLPEWARTGITKNNVSKWLRCNTDRDHFYLCADEIRYLPLLESYLISRLRPQFEGRGAQ
jgi:hypothetical protein